MAEALVESDLACEACGYNLRALPFSHCCPECGEPVMKTFESAALKWQKNAANYYAISALADAIGSTIDAVLFVKDAILVAMMERRNTADADELPEMNATDICHAVATFANQYFNDHTEALELLREWKIEGSEDIGRIVFALISSRQLNGAADERQEDFENLFALNAMFEGGREDCPRRVTKEHE